MRVNKELAFTGLVAAILVAGLASTLSWTSQAALLPRFAGIAALAVVLVEAIRELRLTPQLQTDDLVLGQMDTPVDHGIPFPLLVRRSAIAIGWILGLVASIWLFGFYVSVPGFVFTYLLVQGKEKWWVALAGAALAWATLFGLFDKVLHLPFHEGVASSLLTR